MRAGAAMPNVCPCPGLQVYDALDRSEGFYSNRVDPAYRSHTAIPFRWGRILRRCRIRVHLHRCWHTTFLTGLGRGCRHAHSLPPVHQRQHC